MNSKKFIQILSSFIVLSCLPNLEILAQDIPDLILSIHLAEADTHTLEYYKKEFSEKGLKKLFSEGLFFCNGTYNFPISSTTEAIASLYTGTYPYKHQIGFNFNFDKIFSSQSRGINTSKRVSGESLPFETITDVLQINCQKRANIYAIASSYENAITLGGKYANAVMWIEPYSLFWASNYYYKKIPSTLYNYNKGNKALFKKKRHNWTPLEKTRKSKLSYLSLSPHNFSHSFQGAKGNLNFITSPLINEAITDLTKELIFSLAQQKNATPSFISVSFSLHNQYTSQSSYSREGLDTYLRTDKCIEELLNYIEKYFNKKNCWILLTTSPSIGHIDSNNEKISSFSPYRCKAIVNLYLSALYGKNNWVTQCTASTISLNRELINRKSLSLLEIQEKVSLFLEDMSVVSFAFPCKKTRELFSKKEICIRNAIPKDANFDILFELNSNTQIEGGNRHLYKRFPQYTPTRNWMIFYHLGHKKGVKITRPTDMISWSSTIAHIFKIRPPTLSETLPLEEFL